jgi:lysophospholipase L1-like esterase
VNDQGALQRGRRGVGALAAYAAGAITAAGALGVGVLLGQVLVARRTIPGAEAPPPRSSGMYGSEYSGAPVLRLAVLGDSTAAGYGVATRAETPGALLSTWIADAARRPVRLTCPAIVGSVSAWLPVQVETVVEAGTDLAIIFIGANDVTTRASETAAVGFLAQAVAMLRETGAQVVVATCPDLGTIRPIQPPLRWLARTWSRHLAAAQTIAVVRAGGRTVALADLLGPQFDAAPDRMFGRDRFHPSAEGYAAAAKVVLPSALAALGLGPEEQELGPKPPLPTAAAAAVEVPGSVVRAEAVAPPDERAGPWSGLRKLISMTVPALARGSGRVAAGSRRTAIARTGEKGVLVLPADPVPSVETKGASASSAAE